MSQTPIIAGRPVQRIRIGKQGLAGPPGPTALSELEFTGADLVLDAAHAGKIIYMNSPSPQTVTVPANIWPAGEQAVFHRYGAGEVQFVAGSGAPTIQSEGGMRKIAAQHGQVALGATNVGGALHFVLAGRLGL